MNHLKLTPLDGDPQKFLDGVSQLFGGARVESFKCRTVAYRYETDPMTGEQRIEIDSKEDILQEYDNWINR